MESDERYQIAAQCGLLSDLTTEERWRLASVGMVMHFPPGTVVLQEGAPGSSLCIVGNGRLEVRKAGRKIAELGPGDLLGEMALFNKSIRTAEVRALELARVLFIQGTAFIALVQQGDAGARRMAEKLRTLAVQRHQGQTAAVSAPEDEPAAAEPQPPVEPEPAPAEPAKSAGDFVPPDFTHE
jgi:CRP/FNR family transcriptional regulator, cyclic AMP receptor protein